LGGGPATKGVVEIVVLVAPGVAGMSSDIESCPREWQDDRNLGLRRRQVGGEGGGREQDRRGGGEKILKHGELSN